MALASYPGRQRNRRLVRALQHGTWALVTLVLAGLVASAGLATIALVLLLACGALSASCHHWLGLARRSAVGARSEQYVRETLDRLTQEGWRIRHSLHWLGGGDIDHLATAPGPRGLVFAIETKTRSYGPADLARIAAVARWQAQRRSGWRRSDAVPILCLAGARGIERWEDGVAVVSLDRLLAVMSRVAGTTPKPAFLR